VPDLCTVKIAGEVAMLKVMGVVHHWEFRVEPILKREVDYVHSLALQQLIIWNLFTGEPRHKWKQ
jgi:hypothetical protein